MRLEQKCVDLIIDRGYAPARLFFEGMTHVVRPINAVVLTDKNNSEVVLCALVPAFEDLVLGDGDGGRALDAAFDLNVT